MRFVLLAVLTAASLSACGQWLQPPREDRTQLRDSESALLELSADYEWLIGDWHLKGTPTSWGDLGADIRHIKISRSGMWVEAQGHLAAENGAFNSEGFSYSGNCLYRIQSREFGVQIEQPTHSIKTAMPVLKALREVFELRDEGGNTSDCREQIARMNSILERGRSVVSIGHFIRSSDDRTMQLHGRFGWRTYVRQ
jgi:hypothetical protein